MIFQYKQYSPSIIRPIIPITILHGEQSVRYEVLVDSGVDICIFHLGIAELLRIKVSSGKPIFYGGITGVRSKAYLRTVQIIVGNHVNEAQVAFGNVPSTGYGIVGQKGFFAFFKVSFNYTLKEIDIKAN